MTVPSGTYSLQSVATDAADSVQTSDPIAVPVHNQPLTAVLIPEDFDVVLGSSALLDASASSAVGIASVTFEVSGNGLTDQVVATGTHTLYGYVAQWNTFAVPDGTYTLQSVATDTVAVSTTSAPVSVTVGNASPSTAVLIPVTGATQSGTAALLDASAWSGVTSVTYELTGADAHQPGHRHGHVLHLGLVRPVEHDERAQRHLPAPKCRVLRRWAERLKLPADHDHCE